MDQERGDGKIWQANGIDNSAVGKGILPRMLPTHPHPIRVNSVEVIRVERKEKENWNPDFP